MTLQTSYQRSSSPSTHMPRLFAYISEDRKPGKGYEYNCYFSASYLAECFIDGKTVRQALLEPITAMGKTDNLPLGEFDVLITRVPERYTAIPGDVMQLRATWPTQREQDRELAL